MYTNIRKYVYIICDIIIESTKRSSVI